MDGKVAWMTDQTIAHVVDQPAVDAVPAVNAVPAVHAVIVAGGIGRRVGGDVPKQYRTLGGSAVLRQTVTAFQAHPAIDRLVLVIGSGHESLCREALQGLELPRMTIGGASRQQSVRAGLALLEDVDGEDIVLIHDAARPFIAPGVIDRVIHAAAAGGAALPGLPVIDTLKSVDENSRIVATVPREPLRHAQTPQGFKLGKLLQAHDRVPDSANVTDDAALMELCGHSITVVEGDPANIKLTTDADFVMMEKLMAASPTPFMEPRTGSGFDVHSFEDGSSVWLGGVEIPHTASLKGHSDADVALHALTDAILGALCDGDIGTHFPPSDPQWKGAASHSFLAHAAHLVAQRGARITHVDLTIICEAPKIGPHRAAMRRRIAEILDLGEDRVSVKGTTTEKLGFTGRKEGIAAQAIASLLVPASEA